MNWDKNEIEQEIRSTISDVLNAGAGSRWTANFCRAKGIAERYIEVDEYLDYQGASMSVLVEQVINKLLYLDCDSAEQAEAWHMEANDMLDGYAYGRSSTDLVVDSVAYYMASQDFDM